MFKELNVKKYKQLKDEIKNSFLAEKLGIQESYANQSTLFKPMLDHTQTENNKLSDNINQILSRIKIFIVNFSPIKSRGLLSWSVNQILMLCISGRSTIGKNINSGVGLSITL